MKTYFIYIRLLGVFSLILFTFIINANPSDVFSNTINSGDESVEIHYNDSLYNYAARIKRFHRPYKGFSYFAPAYIDVKNYSPLFTLDLTIYNAMLDEDSNLKEWSKRHGNIALYRYYHDKYFRQRVDMWNRIYNPNWQYYKSSSSPIGGFNYNYGFGLAGNYNSIYHCAAWGSFYSYGTTTNEYLNAILYGTTALSTTGKLVESSNPEVLKPKVPTTSTPFITKKIITKIPMQSEKKAIASKEDFYSHVTLRTKKRLPNNWRTMPSELRAWFENSDLAPPSVIYPNAIRYAKKGKNYNRHSTKSGIPKTGIWDSSPQFGGSSGGGISNLQSSSTRSSGNANY